MQMAEREEKKAMEKGEEKGENMCNKQLMEVHVHCTCTLYMYMLLHTCTYNVPP